MKMTLNDWIQELSQPDVDTLHSIYSHRCLNEEQIHQLNFINSAPDPKITIKIAQDRIKALLSYGMIREVEYLAVNRAYFLTPRGIEMVRHFFSMPTNIYDPQRKVVNRGYYRASELDLYPRLINHQIHLNQFVIDFMGKKPDIPVRYYDEKFASHFTTIRPDGILSFPDVDVFLEMDMATESKKQLCDKWENYRNFLNSREYQYKERRIVVLFIVGNTHREKERGDAIKYTIYERLLDIIDSEFEIIVGTHEELMSHLLDRLLPSFKGLDKKVVEIEESLSHSHEFILSDGEQLSKVFPRLNFKWYMRKLNHEQKIAVEKGRVQEFLVDEYINSPISVIAKIAYYEKYNIYFKEKFNREIAYLVIAENENQLRDELQMIDMLGTPNVFYTTVKRLKTKSFPNALFQFDLLGNIYHFKDNGLEERIFEGS